MKTKSLVARLKRALNPALAVSVLLSFSLVASAKAAAGDIPAQPDHNPPFSAINVLGDSLSDTGRAAAVMPGVFAFLYPSPPYAQGRLSNGPLWIEYFAPQVRLAYAPLDNFSWAGANTGTVNVFPGLPGMKQQLAELLASSGGRLDKSALYVVFGGSNDFFQFFVSPPADPAVVIPAGIFNLVTTVVALRSAGAENIVVVDLPDVGLTPRGLAGGAQGSAIASALSIAFNNGLYQALDLLPFPVVRVGLFNLLNEFRKNPSKYGIRNTKDQGKNDPANADGYLFWDDIHPTTRGHQLIATEVYHALASAGKLGQQKN
jgi:phospholipase/lecithinase/hemolysin